LAALGSGSGPCGKCSASSDCRERERAYALCSAGSTRKREACSVVLQAGFFKALLRMNYCSRAFGLFAATKMLSVVFLAREFGLLNLTHNHPLFAMSSQPASILVVPSHLCSSNHCSTQGTFSSPSQTTSQGNLSHWQSAD
jgi:hypothetical protein